VKARGRNRDDREPNLASVSIPIRAVAAAVSVERLIYTKPTKKSSPNVLQLTQILLLQ
jgi:hypothetical protein